MKSQDDEEIPRWTNFICPSCGIAYGVKALIKAIRKRRQKKRKINTLMHWYKLD